LRLLRSAGKDS